MKRHPTDALSLIFGLLFVVLGLTFLIPAQGEQLAIALQSVLSWAGPLLVIIAGLALILPSLRTREEVDLVEEPGPVPELDSDLDLTV
jgi:phage-related protein